MMGHDTFDMHNIVILSEAELADEHPVDEDFNIVGSEDESEDEDEGDEESSSEGDDSDTNQPTSSKRAKMSSN